MAGLAVLAGTLAALGQEPFGLWWVALPGYALLVWLVANRRGAGWLALIGGAAHFALALNWITEPFLVDAAAYAWMIPFAVVFLSFGLALFWMAAAMVATRLPRPALAFALTLTAAEMLRGHVLTGFPWALPGHIWFHAPVIQTASLFGGYGLTLLTLLAAAGLSRLRIVPMAGAALLVAAAWGLGIRDLSQPDPAPRDVTLRLIQPNAEQALKWDPALAQTHFDLLMRLTAEGPLRDLTIWPETALPYSLDLHPEIFGMIGGVGHNAPVAIGAQRMDGDLAWNSLTVIAPDGAEAARYDKAHLVPFGEYIPAGDVMFRLFGVRAFASQAGAGYSAGPGPRVVDLGQKLGKVLPLICYEAVFPQDVRAAPDRADWMLQITNDAWFGSLTGPFQHAALARLRAIEMGLPLVRVGNTGVTAVYDARGRTIASLPFQTEGALDVTLPGARPPTPYARFGETPVLVLLAGLSLALIRPRHRRVA
ncbi:apolipoprotein N-acyltransferase [Tabrizicola sp. KVB23]|uniref:Apolipoprotein N-acyltransferase n=1 Tax=Fuscibacter oryzae TaxID=2803939 RepID=A0A8J7SU28_9RHOB|nr:apolipoprotein N-acyltransferase [Fuscibacter oryzae]